MELGSFDNAGPDDIQRGLMQACRYGPADVAVALMKRVEFARQSNALLTACKNGNINVLRAIIADGGLDNLINERKYQALIFAIVNMQLEVAMAIPFNDDETNRRYAAIEKAISIILSERNGPAIEFLIGNQGRPNQGICMSAGTAAGYYIAYEDGEMVRWLATKFVEGDIETAMSGLLRRKSFCYSFHAWVMLLGFPIDNVEKLVKALDVESLYEEDMRYIVCGLDEPAIHRVIMAMRPQVRSEHLPWLSLYVSSLPHGVFAGMMGNNPCIGLMTNRYGAEHVNSLME